MIPIYSIQYEHKKNKSHDDIDYITLVPRQAYPGYLTIDYDDDIGIEYTGSSGPAPCARCATAYTPCACIGELL